MDEGGGGLAGEAHVHARVDHGLHEEEDVGRTGAGDGGAHVYEGLVVNVDRLPETAQHVLNPLPLIRADAVRAAPHSHPLPDLRGRVGHAPRHLGHARPVREARYGRPGDDAQYDRVFPQRHAGLTPRRLPPRHGPRPPYLGVHLLDVLRLDGKHDEVGVRDAVGYVLRGADSRVGRRHPLHGRRRHVVYANVRRRLDVGIDEGGDHGLGHLPGSDKGDLMEGSLSAAAGGGGVGRECRDRRQSEPPAGERPPLADRPSRGGVAARGARRRR
mmetsp:Transcript_38743/g.116391  ORF Transcript_38743/g.116391 Transcript_38743/m.116391 type:complete len:272 (+) Transcript_38743:596-1411(+)